MSKENGKVVWPIIGAKDSFVCPHRVVTNNHFVRTGKMVRFCGEETSVTCGHPAATGAPCAYWCCPIAQPVEKEEQP
jgi:hypothetical protein